MRALSGMKSGVVQAKRQSTVRVTFLIALAFPAERFQVQRLFNRTRIPGVKHNMHACVAAIN